MSAEHVLWFAWFSFVAGLSCCAPFLYAFWRNDRRYRWMRDNIEIGLRAPTGSAHWSLEWVVTSSRRGFDNLIDEKMHAGQS